MRKAFTDTRKWWIWKDKTEWVVTPPIGYDPDDWEKRFHEWSNALGWWELAYEDAKPMVT